ncbi:MAG: YhjD/YihY/BrkB family envelope integrity protein [Phycisphaerales bacterium]
MGEVLQRLGVYLGQDAMPRMAAALAYRTVFSLIPFLVLSFLVFRLFPNSKELIEDFINQGLTRSGLAALSTDKESVGTWIQKLVDGFQGINFGAIGAVSAVVFIYGALSLLVDIESAFNTVYGASKPRTWGRRIAHYWLIITLGPLFLSMGFAVGEKFNQWAQQSVRQVASFVESPREQPPPTAAPTSADEPSATPSNPATPPAGGDTSPPPTSNDPSPPATAAAGSTSASPATKPPADGWFTGTIIRGVGYLVTISLAAILLFVLYTTVPNTAVRFLPALAGAFTGGLFLEVAKTAFQTFFRTESYTTLYGSLALMPLFLLWVYITWFIVLFGLRVAFLVQHGRAGALLSAFRASATTRVGATWLEPAHAVTILVDIGNRFMQGKTSKVTNLAESSGMDEPTTRLLISRLEESGIINRVISEGREETYTLARPADTIAIAEIVAVGQSLAGPPSPGATGALLMKIRAAQLNAVSGVSLASLLSRREQRAKPASKAASKPGEGSGGASDAD